MGTGRAAPGRIHIGIDGTHAGHGGIRNWSGFLSGMGQ